MQDLPTEEIELDPSLQNASDPEAVDNGDGTTTLTVDSDRPDRGPSSFASNLADELDDGELDYLASKYLDLIEQDMEAREGRDKQYAEGLKKTGIETPAPGGASFEGASRVTHPVLAEAYVDFAASAIKELFPPNGPVRTKIDGKPNHEKMDKANRKASFMNWQLVYDVKGYRSELERLLTQLPAGGTQFMKIFWSEDKGRIDVEFIPIDDFILPYNAKNFYDCQRKFHRMYVSALDMDLRIHSGLYRDYNFTTSGGMLDMEQSRTAMQNDKIEGKKQDAFNDDQDRIIYEGVVYEKLEGDKRPVPYLIIIDHEDKKVLGLYRHWREGDTRYEELDHVVDFNFIPWRGAYGIGLPQLIGGLADSMTGSLRALMDSAIISTMPAAIKLKSMQGGGDNSIDPTQITEIDALGGDDIRKIAMPLPFPGPSPVLFQLLGFLTQAAQGVVGTANEKLADASNNMPVGTALALIEQGAKVFSSIHARLHDSQRRVLEIIHRLNAEHLPEKVQYGSDPEDYVTRKDFDGRMDVHPVSDPNIFSEGQRFAQVQALIQMVTQLAPVDPSVVQKVDVHKLIERSLELMKFPNYEEVLPPKDVAKPINPVNENINLVMGKPVKAFEGQDHQAHIQVHLDFAQNQFFGLSPVTPPQFMIGMINHIQDHLLTFYKQMMELDAKVTLGDQEDDVNKAKGSAEALAQASKPALKATELAFGAIPQLIQSAMQHMQANAPHPPVDPAVQIAQQSLQQQSQLAQANLSFKQQQHLDDMKYKMAGLQEKMAMLQNDMNLEREKLGLQSHGEIQAAQVRADTELQKTAMNNQTAKDIVGMKIASDHASHLIDGGSLSESPKG